MLRAASNEVFVSASETGLSGLPSKAMVVALGSNSWIASRRFAVSSADSTDTPVIFPPGRLRLATRPEAIGSIPRTKTIGIVEVEAFAARAGGEPDIAAMTVTC